MKSAELKTELTRFISQELLADRPDINLAPADDLLSENLLDSMGIMRLVSFLDERFQFAVPPEDVTIENFLSVNDICRYLVSHLNNSG